MAGELVEIAGHRLQIDGRGPRAGVGLRVGDRVLVADGVGGGAGEALHEVHAVGGALVGGLAVEVGRLDDQGVTFPAAARVAHPLADGVGDARTPVERHDAGVVVLFGPDHDVAGGLQQPHVVVVAAGRHRGSGLGVVHAALAGRAVLRPVGRPPQQGPTGVAPRASRFRERDAAVRGIDDERRPPRRLAPVEPEGVVGARIAGRRGLVAARQRVRVEGRDLLRGQAVPSRVPLGPLQRRDRRERPGALEVRVAPRGARHGPVFGRGLRLPRGPRGQQPRRRDCDAPSGEKASSHLTPPGKSTCASHAAWDLDTRRTRPRRERPRPPAAAERRPARSRSVSGRPPAGPGRTPGRRRRTAPAPRRPRSGRRSA